MCNYCIVLSIVIVFFVFICALPQVVLGSDAKLSLVQSIHPDDGRNNIHLYSDVFVKFKKPVMYGEMAINGVPGPSHIHGCVISFCQAAIFKPATSYEVKVMALLEKEETPIYFTYSFTTADMDGQIWVEVDLSFVHLVRVFNGQELIRVMIASGGKESTPTVLGTYFISDRGPRFWSDRFNEGALYWVRFHKNYLFHSIPRDQQWNMKESEEKKIGGPASHGCIRLLDRDAKWFYENIPEETMVIIHELKSNITGQEE